VDGRLPQRQALAPAASPAHIRPHSLPQTRACGCITPFINREHRARLEILALTYHVASLLDRTPYRTAARCGGMRSGRQRPSRGLAGAQLKVPRDDHYFCGRVPPRLRFRVCDRSRCRDDAAVVQVPTEEADRGGVRAGMRSGSSGAQRWVLAVRSGSRQAEHHADIKGRRRHRLAVLATHVPNRAPHKARQCDLTQSRG
jgi:hypothetical protein